MNCQSIISESDIKHFYNNFLEYLKVDRKRENPRHLYLKNRFKEIIKKSDSVLDLGCGIGITTEYIYQLGVKEVIGVDLSPKLIEFARKTVDGVKFIVQDITNLEFNKKFDVITMCDVMEHIPKYKYEKLFYVIKSHLKDNGKIYISIPDPEYLKYFGELFPERLQIIDNSIYLEEIQRLCDKNNLKIKLFNVYGIHLENEYNEYLLVSKDNYNQWSILEKYK